MNNVYDIKPRLKQKQTDDVKNTAISQIKKLDSIFKDLSNCQQTLSKHQQLLAVNRILVLIQKTKNEISDIQRSIASNANETIKELQTDENDNID